LTDVLAIRVPAGDAEVARMELAAEREASHEADIARAVEAHPIEQP